MPDLTPHDDSSTASDQSDCTSVASGATQPIPPSKRWHGPLGVIATTAIPQRLVAADAAAMPRQKLVVRGFSIPPDFQGKVRYAPIAEKTASMDLAHAHKEMNHARPQSNRH